MFVPAQDMSNNKLLTPGTSQKKWEHLRRVCRGANVTQGRNVRKPLSANVHLIQAKLSKLEDSVLCAMDVKNVL